MARRSGIFFRRDRSRWELFWWPPQGEAWPRRCGQSTCVWLTETRREGLHQDYYWCKTDTLLPIIKQKIVPDSIVYSDCLPSYNVLDVSEFKHYRINHSKLFADKHNHINGIENFWNQAKRHMRKFNGIPKHNFVYFLKECEWRFNNPNPKQQIKQLKQLITIYLT